MNSAFVPVETCTAMCDDQMGCIACKPGTGVCQGNVSTYCLPDGTGTATETCDPVQGVTCNPNSGVCEGPCAPSTLGRSYIGCEYFPVVTANEVDPSFSFGVAVANTSDLAADITIEGPGLPTAITFSVDPKRVKMQDLPWVDLLKDAKSALVSGGAYHLRSTQPVTVYQFSPTEFEHSGTYSFTNDASLLLPAAVWGDKYFAATYQNYVLPGLVSITAAQDGTEVMITPRDDSNGANGSPDLLKGIPTTVTLNQGDVLQITDSGGDLTGSLVTSNKPVQVLGAHDCARVPTNLNACDHLEESMFPVDTLSRTYLVATTALPSLPDGKVEVVRIVATEDNTTLSYEPPQAGAANTLAAAGDFVELSLTAATFQVSGDKKILVAQLMTGQEAGGNAGDPSLSLAVPVDQYRSEYLFHAPLSYDTNYINITAPSGAVITLDAAMVTGFSPIGNTGYSLARVVLTQGNEGNHFISGDKPFGISVYGYGSYTSYWYPGGLALNNIVL
jgi:hypothetical protein